MYPPGRIRNLAQGSALIGVCDGASDDDAMNPRTESLAVGESLTG
jgi:hypothetical protein